MGKETLVVFQSKYGSTRQYAEWIADALKADLRERREVTADMLREYECVIYGGGLYASGISGVDLVTKNPCKHLVVFTVGAADPATTDYTKILEKNFPLEVQKLLKVFHLRGALDYKKLGVVHRGMMAMMKKITLEKKSPEEWTGEEKTFANTYGKKADFVNPDTITPLTEYVRGLFADGKNGGKTNGDNDGLH
jgi:menaquinone-dependent protoporphyrinogen IX oxidase